MLRVGRTSTDFCERAGAFFGSAPISRYVLPSMRIRLTSEWSCRVQCFVVASFKWSVSDQMLRKGLYVTSGTAGGRKPAPAAGAMQKWKLKSAATSIVNEVLGILVIEVILWISLGSAVQTANSSISLGQPNRGHRGRRRSRETCRFAVGPPQVE